ncbi:MAG: MerR family transcriptional regulator [Thermoanaerobaculia bacterium]
MADAPNPNPPAGTPAGPEPRYKIGDVCRIADVQPYVLRYWESEFPSLAADRSVSGPRTYSARELRIIEQIKKLLYDEGYTIAGAKKKLEVELSGRPADAESEAPAAPRAREKAAAEVRARASRPAPEIQLPFDDEAAPETSVKVAAAAAPPCPDPRLPAAVKELKELLKLLSRKP